MLGVPIHLLISIDNENERLLSLARVACIEDEAELDLVDPESLTLIHKVPDSCASPCPRYVA